MILYLKDLAILARVKLLIIRFSLVIFPFASFLLYFVFTRLPEGFSNYLGKINISCI